MKSLFQKLSSCTLIGLYLLLNSTLDTFGSESTILNNQTNPATTVVLNEGETITSALTRLITTEDFKSVILHLSSVLRDIKSCPEITKENDPLLNAGTDMVNLKEREKRLPYAKINKKLIPNELGKSVSRRGYHMFTKLDGFYTEEQTNLVRLPARILKNNYVDNHQVGLKQNVKSIWDNGKLLILSTSLRNENEFDLSKKPGSGMTQYRLIEVLKPDKIEATVKVRKKGKRASQTTKQLVIKTEKIYLSTEHYNNGNTVGATWFEIPPETLKNNKI